jgi:hypothetical protein
MKSSNSRRFFAVAKEDQLRLFYQSGSLRQRHLSRLFLS